MQEARITVRCGDAGTASALRGALEPESEDSLGGVVIRVEKGTDPDGFLLVVTAPALPALRAATNSLLKRLKAADAALDASA